MRFYDFLGYVKSIVPILPNHYPSIVNLKQSLVYAFFSVILCILDDVSYEVVLLKCVAYAISFFVAVLPKQAHLLCGLCDKTFANPHNLSVHLKTHSKNDDSNDTQSKKEKREFPCPTCMKIFKTSSHLKRHMITHTG